MNRSSIHLSASLQRRIQTCTSAFLLSGTLFTGLAFGLQSNAIATPQSSMSPSELAQQVRRNNGLPVRIRNGVRRDLARQLNVPVGRIRVVDATRQTWMDSCLGIHRPEELCAMGTVEGWRVELTNGQQNWVYRTDMTGRVYRMETMPIADIPADSPNDPSVVLPRLVGGRIIQTVADQFRVPVSSLDIVEAESQTWNGCFGIDPGAGGACTEIAISGWRVIVKGDQRTWIYHTNQDGTDIRLNAIASQTDGSGASVPSFIPASNLPPALENGVVFRAISSGGIAGQTSETVLLNDGRVVRSATRQGESRPQVIRRLSRQQVQQFQQMLAEQRFSSFDRLNYSGWRGAADYIIVTLTSGGTTTQYADMAESELPTALQQVIRNWNAIAQAR